MVQTETKTQLLVLTSFLINLFNYLDIGFIWETLIHAQMYNKRVFPFYNYSSCSYNSCPKSPIHSEGICHSVPLCLWMLPMPTILPPKNIISISRCSRLFLWLHSRKSHNSKMWHLVLEMLPEQWNTVQSGIYKPLTSVYLPTSTTMTRWKWSSR